MHITTLKDYDVYSETFRFTKKKKKKRLSDSRISFQSKFMYPEEEEREKDVIQIPQE